MYCVYIYISYIYIVFIGWPPHLSVGPSVSVKIEIPGTHFKPNGWNLISSPLWKGIVHLPSPPFLGRVTSPHLCLPPIWKGQWWWLIPIKTPKKKGSQDHKLQTPPELLTSGEPFTLEVTRHSVWVKLYMVNVYPKGSFDPSHWRVWTSRGRISDP